jgi:hypothetical protein
LCDGEEGNRQVGFCVVSVTCAWCAWLLLQAPSRRRIPSSISRRPKRSPVHGRNQRLRYAGRVTATSVVSLPLPTQTTGHSSRSGCRDYPASGPPAGTPRLPRGPASRLSDPRAWLGRRKMPRPVYDTCPRPCVAPPLSRLMTGYLLQVPRSPRKILPLP